MTNYLVATIKDWNVAEYRRRSPLLAGKWDLCERPEDLTAGAVDATRPRYIFFPHWSWRVPKEILGRAECVCFHMTDVPYGRGGSPLQNLIARGHTDTVVSALRMVEELDAGPVYAKRPLSLHGSAQQIYERAASIVFDLIEAIVRSEPKPVPQEGAPTYFERRRPEQSVLPNAGELPALHDHIRMLDAEGYPAAFLEHGAFRIEFHDSQVQDEELTARVTIRRRGDRR